MQGLQKVYLLREVCVTYYHIAKLGNYFMTFKFNFRSDSKIQFRRFDNLKEPCVEFSLVGGVQPGALHTGTEPSTLLVEDVARQRGDVR